MNPIYTKKHDGSIVEVTEEKYLHMLRTRPYVIWLPRSDGTALWCGTGRCAQEAHTTAAKHPNSVIYYKDKPCEVIYSRKNLAWMRRAS